MDICIYHENCNDGFGAAYSVWKKFGISCDYVACQYGDAPPDVTDNDVIIVDFSFPKEVLLEMAEKAKSITVLDHHETAQENLEELIDHEVIQGVFDMDRSGAMIAWDYFHGPFNVPSLIEYIQDRDLFRFEKKGTQFVHLALSVLEKNFSIWDAYMMDCDNLQSLLTEGRAMHKYYRFVVEELKKTAFEGYIDEHLVPIVNCPGIFVSDVVGELSDGKPFAAGYSISSLHTNFSLRSKEGGVAVSKIAKRFGGGGHKHAAGFRKNRSAIL